MSRKCVIHVYNSATVLRQKVVVVVVLLRKFSKFLTLPGS